MGKKEQPMGVSQIDDCVALPFPFVSVRGLEKNSGKPLKVTYDMDFFIYGRNCYIWPAHMSLPFNPYNVTQTHSIFLKL